MSLPLGVVLSLLGTIFDAGKAAGKVGLVLGLINVVVFVGLPLFASILC